MVKIKLLLIFLLFSIAIVAQSNFKTGKIGYTSSQLVYVNFENTDGISVGDTLFIKSKNKQYPALVVKYLSSSSAACEKLNGDDFKPGLEVYALIKKINESINPNIPVVLETNPNIVKPLEKITEPENISTSMNNTKISGRYSLQSYTSFNNIDNRGEYQRWRHSLRFGLQNIGGSGLSFSTYSIFAYRADQWKSVSSSLGKAIKVYDLNLIYQFDESAKLWFGRHLNRKISNISIVDGLQFEKAYSFLTFGLVAGSRPNFTDFGLNTKLFEYGVYLSRYDTVGNGMMENTFSIFQQTNDFKTDRRFAYLQHNNTMITNTNLFASAEVDLYKKEIGIGKNDFSLTSLYLSARYSPVREFSLSLSYDARKNVYYYETFKSISDSVLENETRQGFRARTVIRPINNLTVGLHFGYRYSKTDFKPNRNYGGNISYTVLPLIESSLGFNFNKLISSYVDGHVYSITLQKSLSAIRSDFLVGFRKTDYSFPNNTPRFEEKAILFDFSTSVLNPLSFSVSYEGVFELTRAYGRILFDISTRF